jgi:hypothetical protein
MSDTDTTAAPQTVDEYKATVRALALELKNRFAWCDEETNTYLERLGLEPLPTPKQYVFTVTTTGKVRYEVTDYDEAAARAVVARHVEADQNRANGSYGYRSPQNGRVTEVKYGTEPVLVVSESASDDEDEDEDLY